MIHRKRLYADLRIFLTCVTFLIIIGLIFIYASSSVYALEQYGSSTYYVKKQAFACLIGLIAIGLIRLIPLTLIKRLTPLFFFSSLALTALTLVPQLGQRIHGSSRWLAFAGFSFQPSELLKISLILYCAYFLTKKGKQVASFIHGYLPFLIILGLTSFILLRQPDFGLTATLVMTIFIMLFIAQFQTKHLIITISALIPAAIVLIVYKPYRFKRVLTFLNPWTDPQGAGFQIIQSLIAIGSGSFWGVGIGNSKQKFFYLPMQHTDFIFSIIAEETGFIGSVAVIILFALVLYFGMRIAWQLNDSYSVFATLGFVILISMQALINIAVATGLVPTKGMGLPFVSYGNSALISNLLMIGLIIVMVRENRNHY